MGDDSQSNPAASGTGPEKVCVVIVRVCVDDGAVEKYYFHANQVVHSNAISVGLERDASPKEEATNTNRRSPRAKECPSCAIEGVVDVAGIISATDLQNGPVQGVALGRADVGACGEFSSTNLVPMFLVREIRNAAAAMERKASLGGLQINDNAGRLSPSKVCVSSTHWLEVSTRFNLLARCHSSVGTLGVGMNTAIISTRGLRYTTAPLSDKGGRRACTD